MPWSVKQNPELGLIEVVYSGRVTMDDIKGATTQALALVAESGRPGRFLADFSDVEFDTIGGLVIQAFGHMPARNESTIVGDFEFKVINADQRKIHSLRMRPLET